MSNTASNNSSAVSNTAPQPTPVFDYRREVLQAGLAAISADRRLNDSDTSPIPRGSLFCRAATVYVRSELMQWHRACNNRQNDKCVQSLICTEMSELVARTAVPLTDSSSSSRASYSNDDADADAEMRR